MLSHFSHVQLFVTLWTLAFQGSSIWDSPGKNTGVGSHSLLQWIFPTQVSSLHLQSPIMAGRFFTDSAKHNLILNGVYFIQQVTL